MNYRDSDKMRLLKTLQWESTDRIPNLETLYESNHVDAILGRTWGKSSWELPPADQVELAARTGIDFLFMGGYAKFGQQYKTMDDGSVQYIDGRIKDREVFRDWDFAGDFGRRLEQTERTVRGLTEAAAGTAVGVAVALRSVFADTSLSMGMTDFMMNIYDDPELVEQLMDVYLDFALQVVDIVSRYPVDLVMIDDDLSDSQGLMLGVRRTRDLWLPRTRVLTDALNSIGMPYIGHCCGNLDEVLPMLVELGYLGIHPIQPDCNDIYAIREEYGRKIALIGNIDILQTLSLGTKQDVAADVREHLVRLGKDGGYVLTSSHTMVNSIPFSNYETMLEALHAFGAGC